MGRLAGAASSSALTPGRQAIGGQAGEQVGLISSGESDLLCWEDVGANDRGPPLKSDGGVGRFQRRRRRRRCAEDQVLTGFAV